MAARVVADDAAGLAEAIAVLRRGGVIATPTDTVYGIAVALDTPAGIERLYEVKRRPPEKAVMVLLDGIEQVAELVDITPAARALTDLWPGGLTLVLPLRGGSPLPSALTAGTPTLGVRVPDHDTPRAIARAVGPLPATSANPSGQPEARSADDVVATLGDRLDLVVDGGVSRGGVPSTVVDCATEPVRILRPGAIATAAIAARLDRAGIPHVLRAEAG